MKEINDNKYPLVSILIPTYNRPYYFELALESALKQTYPNIEILIGDDSTNEDTASFIQKKYKMNSKITYIRNPRTLGQFQNDLNLLNKAKGTYINFLMDDDLFSSEKIEKMMAYFMTDHNKEIAIVTSFRKLIDEDGNNLPDGLINTKINETDVIKCGKEVGNQMLMNTLNLIGEPTTPLFRKEALSEPFGTLANRRYLCSVDFASWIVLLSKGKIAYISEPLSFFRIHPNQQFHSKLVDGIEDLTHLVTNSKHHGFLEQKKEQEIALNSVLQWIEPALLFYIDSEPIKKRLLDCQQVLQNELSTL